MSPRSAIPTPASGPCGHTRSCRRRSSSRSPGGCRSWSSRWRCSCSWAWRREPAAWVSAGLLLVFVAGTASVCGTRPPDRVRLLRRRGPGGGRQRPLPTRDGPRRVVPLPRDPGRGGGTEPAGAGQPGAGLTRLAPATIPCPYPHAYSWARFPRVDVVGRRRRDRGGGGRRRARAAQPVGDRARHSHPPDQCSRSPRRRARRRCERAGDHHQSSDFQCPGCDQLHQLWEPTLEQLIQQGKVKFEFVGLEFLDRGTTESLRSAAAATCAAKRGSSSTTTTRSTTSSHSPRTPASSRTNGS